MNRFFLILIVLLLGLAACQSSPPNSPIGQSDAAAEQTTPMPALSPDEIALGETVYAANCAACHGANLEGEEEWKVQNDDKSFRAPPHDDSGHTWHHGDLLLLEAIVLGGARYDDVNVGGTSNMPAFGESLTDEEITAVLSYIKNSWPNDIRQIQWDATLREQAQLSE